MPKYRPKMSGVEAVQWTGKNDKEVLAITGFKASIIGREKSLAVNHRDGHSRVPPDYWIVLEADGELTVYSPVRFEALYELAE